MVSFMPQKPNQAKFFFPIHLKENDSKEETNVYIQSIS